MAEDSPKYHPTFEDEVKSPVVGENNIIINYYNREDVRGKPVESEETAAEEKLPCPYRGLFHFGPNDAEFFFGRDIFIEELYSATKTRNFIPVLGASGSGKSSVVLAGLVPKLQKEGHWKFTHFRPGSDPFHALALALVPLYTRELDDTEQIAQTRKLAGYLSDNTVSISDVFAKVQQNHFNHRILLIADQFEEIYIQCSDHTVRNRFLNCLLASFQSSNYGSSSSTVLVTTMRADFLANALSYRPFAGMLKNADVKLGAMNQEELTEVIEKPAKKLGVMFEAGLVERILNDVENEPGNLPLLEFALTELWKKRTGKQLTHGAYKAIGQVKGALADYADDKYKKLTSGEQEQARRIFIQLVRPGEGTENTRRRANRSELGEDNWNLITRKDGLVDSRLVVTDRNDNKQETVEVVHEALIQKWDRLSGWMVQDGLFRSWQERLRVARGQWKDNNQDESELLRGFSLVQAEDWFKKRKEELSPDERNFIQQSLDRQKAKRDLNNRRRNIIIVVLAGFSLFAGYQWRQAEIGQIRALRTSSEALFVLNDQSLEVLIESLRAAKKLKQLGWLAIWTEDGLGDLVTKTLHQAVDNVVERNRLEGHKDLVSSVAFSPEKKNPIVASASYDNTVKLWNLKGQELRTLKGHTDRVRSVAFSPDGQTIASASYDNTVKLWNREGDLLNTLTWAKGELEKKMPFFSVAFSPDGEIVAAGSKNGIIKLWQRDDRRQDRYLYDSEPPQNSINSVTFSRDGQFLASASDDGTVKVWNWKRDDKPSCILKVHKGWVTSVAFSPDGNTLVSGSYDKSIKLWDRQECKELLTLKGHQGHVFGVTFSTDGKLVASASADRTVKLWNREGQELLTLRGHDDWVRSVAFSNDGLIASASGDTTIRLWDRGGKKHFLFRLRAHEDVVTSIAFSPKGRILASGSYDKTVKLWNLEEDLLHPLRQYDKPITYNDVVTSVAFNRSGSILAIGNRDNTIKLWNIKEQHERSNLEKHADWVTSVAFNPKEDLLASASDDRTIILWDLNRDLKSGEKTGTITGHASWVSSVAFSPTDNILASASNDKMVKLWSIENMEGKLVRTLPQHNTNPIRSVAFSPNGEIIASTDDRTVKLWNLKGENLHILRGHKGKVISIAFSPNGSILASGSQEGNVKLWNLVGKELHTLHGHHNGVNSLSFSPDGKLLASADSGGTIILWTLQNVESVNLHSTFLDQWIVLSCNWVRDYLNYHRAVSESDRFLCEGIDR